MRNVELHKKIGKALRKARSHLRSGQEILTEVGEGQGQIEPVDVPYRNSGYGLWACDRAVLSPECPRLGAKTLPIIVGGQLVVGEATLLRLDGSVGRCRRE